MKAAGSTFRLLPALLFTLLATATSSPAHESRILVENALISSDQSAGGLTLNLELQPQRDYVFELRGRLERGIPTLRVDQPGSDPSVIRYLPVPAGGLVFRVRNTGKLRLIIYQDSAFSYRLDRLLLRAVAPGKGTISDIFDASLPADRYTLPPFP